MEALRATRLRLAQTAAAVSPDIPVRCEALATAVLSPPLLDAFLSGAEGDRAHQCRVALTLAAAGADDDLLLAAALLHDVGKASADHPPTLADRIALVVLRRLWPRALGPIASVALGPLAGLSVAVRHAEIGANRLRELGADPYLVWLVRNHHREDIRDDPLLTRLQAADRAAP